MHQTETHAKHNKTTLPCRRQPPPRGIGYTRSDTDMTLTIRSLSINAYEPVQTQQSTHDSMYCCSVLPPPAPGLRPTPKYSRAGHQRKKEHTRDGTRYCTTSTRLKKNQAGKKKPSREKKTKKQKTKWRWHLIHRIRNITHFFGHKLTRN